MILQLFKEMEDFREEAREAAKAIRARSLYEGDEYLNAQQVHRSSLCYLADINDLGFLTLASQDALDWRSGYSKPMARSYVAGWMPTAMARKFLLKFNCGNNDQFATICAEVSTDVFRQKRVLCITDWDRVKKSGETYIRGLEDKKLMIEMDANYGEGMISHVQVVDCKWGRPARSKKGLWRAIILALRQSQ